MNFAELSLASIANRHLDGKKTIIIEEPIYDRKDQKYVQRRLTISGSDRFGLPTAIDDDVLLACIQISKLQDFQSPEVRFSRYELLKMLRLPLESKYYARIATSLRRWKGMTIFSDRAFYDHGHKCWVNRDFGIFDTLYIYNRESTECGQVKSTSRFTWNEVIFSNFQAGYLKRLDWNLYTSLENGVSKRLYRLLDKRFYHSQSFELDLRELAVNRVGLSANQNVAQWKRSLAKGILELEQRWDLRSLSIEKRFIKQGRGTWSVRFERKRRSRPTIIESLPFASSTTPALAPTSDPLQLQFALTKRGVGPATAEELSEAFPSQTIQCMIELFDWYNARGQTRHAGFLVQSIRNASSITMPIGFESSQAIQSRKAAESSRIRQQQQISTKREAAASQKQESRLATFTAFWQSMSPIDQSNFERDALEHTDRTKLEGYSRHQGKGGSLFEHYRQAILLDHFERSTSSRC
jgi:hypothetical protein